MALTNVKTPDNFNPAKNGPDLVVTSDEYIKTAATLSTYQLSFATIPVTAQTSFNLVVNGKYYSFKFDTLNPITEDYAVLRILDLATFNAFVAQLQGLYIFDKLFTITGTWNPGTPSASYIQFDQIDLEIPAILDCVDVDAGAIISGTDGEATEYNEDYAALCDVYIKPNGASIYSRAAELKSYPRGVDHEIVFRLSEILQSYHTPLDSLPAVGADTIAPAPGVMIPFYLKYSEEYGQKPTEQNLYTSGSSASPKYSVLAGLDFMEYPGNSWQSDYFSSANGQKFLTRQPGGKKVREDQDEFLLWYNGTQTHKIDVLAFATLEDKSTVAYQVVKALSTQTAKTLYRIPAGYTQLDIGSIGSGSNQVISYKLKVRSYSDAVTYIESEEITYEVDRGSYLGLNQLMFLGSNGCWETFCCRGLLKTSPEFDSERSEIVLPYDYASTDGQQGSYNNLKQQKFEVNSGDVDVETFEWLNELINSKYQFWLFNGQWSRIVVDKNKDNYTNRQNRLGRTIKFQHAFTEVI